MWSSKCECQTWKVLMNIWLLEWAIRCTAWKPTISALESGYMWFMGTSSISKRGVTMITLRNMNESKYMVPVNACNSKKVRGSKIHMRKYFCQNSCKYYNSYNMLFWCLYFNGITLTPPFASKIKNNYPSDTHGCQNTESRHPLCIHLAWGGGMSKASSQAGWQDTPEASAKGLYLEALMTQHIWGNLSSTKNLWTLKYYKSRECWLKEDNWSHILLETLRILCYNKS